MKKLLLFLFVLAGCSHENVKPVIPERFNGDSRVLDSLGIKVIKSRVHF